MTCLPDLQGAAVVMTVSFKTWVRRRGLRHCAVASRRDGAYDAFPNCGDRMPRAILCRKLGTPDDLALEDVASSALGAGRLRVAIAAAGVNFVDLLMVAGLHQHKPPLPFIPGLEAAGTIVEMAADLRPRFAIGERVMIQLPQGGGYAEEAVVVPDQVMPLPPAFDFAEGATFRAAYGTAYHALVDRAGLAAGETLLVHGAGGGMGLAAVDLGKLLGATVIAAASSEEKLRIAAGRGADHLIRYGGEPLRTAVKRVTGQAGADVVFDPVGGRVFEESLHCIAWGARLLVVGFTGGIAAAPTNLVLIKGASVIGVRAGEAGRRDPERRARRDEALSRHAATGRLRPHVSQTLPLERWAEAMRVLSERRAIGRIALVT
jgi:NADPH:quinone reductase